MTEAVQSHVCLCARQARGESDGGGPHGEACSALAAELAALGARLLGLLEEQVAWPWLGLGLGLANSNPNLNPNPNPNPNPKPPNPKTKPRTNPNEPEP